MDVDNKEDRDDGDNIANSSDAISSDGGPFAVVYFREQPFLLFLCSVNGKAIYKDRSGNVELAGCAQPGVGSGKRRAARVERGRSVRDGVAIR